jgi:hypothetical protein
VTRATASRVSSYGIRSTNVCLSLERRRVLHVHGAGGVSNDEEGRSPFESGLVQREYTF